MEERVKYQPSGRAGHRSNRVGNNLYICSGHRKGYPQTHNDEVKQKYKSRVEIFNLITGNWRHCTTTGNPPLSINGYTSAVINDNIIYFGGYCGHERCYHNSVHSLSVDTLNWKELFPTNQHTGPMMKLHSRMIPVKIDGKNYLLVIGGQGPLANTPQQDTAQYSEEKMNQGFIRTNEQNYFSLSTGEWILPKISGDCPPPCDYFSLTSLTNDILVMFGGRTPEGTSNATYIGHYTKLTINWQKVNPPPGADWPDNRYGHDSAVLDKDHIITIGGWPNFDCWIFNIKAKLWKKLTVPESVIKRNFHSVSSFNVTSDIVWVIVFGGHRSSSEQYINDTSVVEIIRNGDGEWSVGEVMTHPLNDYELKLAERRKQSASYLFEHGLQQQSSSFVNVKSVLMESPADTLP